MPLVLLPHMEGIRVILVIVLVLCVNYTDMTTAAPPGSTIRPEMTTSVITQNDPARNNNNTIGLTVPTDDCHPGWYCIQGAWSPTPVDLGNYSAPSCFPNNQTGGQCQPGEFCPGGSSAPQPCTGGSYCGNVELSAVSGPCSAGYYCVSGATRSDPTDGTTGDICSQGHYCEEGIATPTACPAGTYSNTTGNTGLANCLPCTPGSYCSSTGLDSPTGLCNTGYYCPEGQVSAHPAAYQCTPGHYCLQGSVTELSCPNGTYQDEFVQSACKACPAAFYCDATVQNDTICSHGVQNPVPCIPGHYCPAGTNFDTEYKCPIGTFNSGTSLTSESECTPCTAGKYCATTGMSAVTGDCAGGYYCTLGAHTVTPTDGTTGDICPVGYYCPPGSDADTKCPAGTYNPTEGLAAESECKDCDGGKYCGFPGLSAPEGDCSATYYCSNNSVTPRPSDGVSGDVCPEGFYCPEGSSAPIPCAPGFYTSTPLQAACKTCIQGFYCVNGKDNIACPAGFYCSAQTGYDWQSCPPGTFSNLAGLYDVAQCTRCSGGDFCDAANMTSVAGQCDAGYYCRSGSDDATPSGMTAGDAGVCPTGKYCPIGTQEPIDCPAGTFNNGTMLTAEGDCQPCLPGYYCDTPGLDSPSGPCAAGFYCTEGSISDQPPTATVTGGPCPVGHFCVVGTSVPAECPAGRYSDAEQQSSCLDCPTGYYCQAGRSAITICPTVMAACPNGWTRYTGSCYKFMDRKVTWHNAKGYCQDIGGHLARVQSQEENNFLLQALRDRHFLDNKNNYYYWINGNDIAIENEWVWDNNEKITFFDWSPGEPNSAHGRRQEDCVMMVGSGDFHWNDAVCTFLCEFICELEDHAQPKLIG